MHSFEAALSRVALVVCMPWSSSDAFAFSFCPITWSFAVSDRRGGVPRPRPHSQQRRPTLSRSVLLAAVAVAAAVAAVVVGVAAVRMVGGSGGKRWWWRPLVRVRACACLRLSVLRPVASFALPIVLPFCAGNFKTALEQFDENDDGLIDFNEFKLINKASEVPAKHQSMCMLPQLYDE